MFNLGNVGQALKMTGGGAQRSAMPQGVNEALRKTGSSYQVPQQTATSSPGMGPQQAPEWVGKAEDGLGLLDMGGGGPLPEPAGVTNLKNLPAAKLAKKVVGAVAAFYTGGLSAAATNVASNMLSKNNPRAGAALGAISGNVGGMGGGR